MARLRIAGALLEELLFGAADEPVEILGVREDPNSGDFVFDIRGRGVPDCAEVRAIVTQESNRRGDKLIRMHFEAQQ